MCVLPDTLALMGVCFGMSVSAWVECEVHLAVGQPPPGRFSYSSPYSTISQVLRDEWSFFPEFYLSPQNTLLWVDNPILPLCSDVSLASPCFLLGALAGVFTFSTQSFDRIIHSLSAQSYPTICPEFGQAHPPLCYEFLHVFSSSLLWVFGPFHRHLGFVVR